MLFKRYKSTEVDCRTWLHVHINTFLLPTPIFPSLFSRNIPSRRFGHLVATLQRGVCKYRHCIGCPHFTRDARANEKPVFAHTVDRRYPNRWESNFVKTHGVKIFKPCIWATKALMLSLAKELIAIDSLIKHRFFPECMDNKSCMLRLFTPISFSLSLPFCLRTNSKLG